MTRRPETPQGKHGAGGKASLRAEEFLAQRGLSGEEKELSFENGAEPLYLRASRQREAILAEAPPAPGVVWRSLGPAGIPRGQTYGGGPGGTTTVAGRVAAIAVDPANSQHLLVGSAAGGVWETGDTGATWDPRTDDQPTLSIGALAFDPADSSIAYAGTGEGNHAYAPLGHGILRSGDGGTTWSVMPGSRPFASHGFYRLVVDPRDSARLLAATTAWATISSDAGKTWSLLHPERTWDVSLAYLGNKPEVLLAARDGLFAFDGAAAPARVRLPGIHAVQRMAVAHVPSDPGQAFVFAASFSRAFLWHRAGAGKPFVEIPLLHFAVGRSVEDLFAIGQAFYDWYVAVPEPGDAVYLGAIELVRGKRAGGGWSWDDISSRPEHGDSIHPDQHTMAFDPQDPKVIYAGNDGGIFRSPDGGDSWQSLNAGLAISEVEYLTQRPDEPTWILAGLQDNGTVRREAEGEWAQVGLGDGGDCGTDMANPDVCFHSYYDMAMERSMRRGDADSWEEATPPEPEEEFEMLFYPPLEVNGSVVVKAGQIVFLSTDRGGSWVEVPLPPTPACETSVASALAIPAAERVLVGTTQGEVFRIDAGTAGWEAPVRLTRPHGDRVFAKPPRISDLLVDADLPHRYWATFSTPGSVFRSDDEGATWVDVTANLPEKIPVNAIISDPADRDRVWVACDMGVFESTDAGGSWSVFGTGLPNALAEDLAFYAPDRLLRVGTRSRGVWEASVS